MTRAAFATFGAFATLTLAAVLVASPALGQTPAPKATAQKSAPKAPAATAPRNTLAKLRSTKEITVAFSADSLPFSFVDAKQQPAGIRSTSASTSSSSWGVPPAYPSSR
jgi:ABC-type amino acid transport substrate-binding protein